MLKIAIIVAAVALAAAAIFARGWMREHDALVIARGQIETLQRGDRANEAGISELDSGAQEREIRYVTVVREVAAAGPVSAECAADPAWIAAGRGTLRMRYGYCTDHPDRCPAEVVPSPGDWLP